MKWEGTLEHKDIGSGQWTLITDDGQRLSLHGDVPEQLQGCRVTVAGRAVEAFGFSMTGNSEAIEVRTVRRVS